MFNSKKLAVCLKLNTFIYFVLYFISMCVSETDVGGIGVADKLLSEMYLSYKNSLHDDLEPTVGRRGLIDNKKYQMHVMKLKEVNANKRHNLKIKEDNSTNPLIYIKNPVETKIPNAYLTFEEFKKELTDRVLRLREEFVATVSTTKAASKKVEPDQILDSNSMLKLIVDGYIQLLKKDNKLEKITTKVKTKESPVIRAKTTLKYEILANTKLTKTENTKKARPKVAITTKSNSNTAKKASNITTERPNDFTIETSVESPPVTNIVTETTQHEVATQESNESIESTVKHNTDSTTVIETTEVSKRIKLSKPLVWVGGS